MNTQTTAMMERTPFLLPDVAATDTGFTKEELAGTSMASSWASSA